MENKNIKFIFWGVGPLAESALYSLYKNNLIPSLIITSPNKRSGRGLEMEENIIASWCKIKNIKYWQPEKVNLENLIFFLNENNIENNFDLSIVASYPKILKEEILDLPKFKTLNIHPSLLPLYRGPSPIQTALINGDTVTGVTIIKLDKDIDHGPILLQKEISILEEDTNERLERKCGTVGGEMICEILEHYINNNLKLIEQDHDKATFTHKFEKSHGEIKLDDDAEILQNKFKSLLPHISIFFFINHKDKDIRIKISDINLDKDFAKNKKAKNIINKVIPEGKKEMNFEDFIRGYLK